jgi:hypothetical protein
MLKEFPAATENASVLAIAAPTDFAPVFAAAATETGTL